MYLSEIWIYPVKSLGGYRVKHAHVLEAGLKFDRRWMIVDERGRFLTQREIPAMSMIRAEVVKEELILSKTDECSSIIVSDEIRRDLVAVKVWDDEVLAHTSEPWVDAWLSEQLNRPVALVRLAEQANRPFLKDGDTRGTLSFADDFPYHMISQSSLDELNLRLEETIGVDRFRPNLVIGGSLAYDDDRWAHIRIGETIFELPSRCERCMMVNVDEGKITKQPLKTLASYRRDGRVTYFGQNMFATSLGHINEGDLVTVKYRKAFLVK